MPRPVLRTSICELFGIEYPVVLAGMGGITAPSGPELAAAVSNAGGLGVLGGAFVEAGELARWIERTRALTDRPFGVDTLLPVRMVEDGDTTVTWEVPETHARFVEDFRERHDLPASHAVPPLFDRQFLDRQMEVVLDLEVPVYVAGLGDPGPYIDRLRDKGITVGSVVGATRHAERALASGVDFVVAQGHDGGGHNSRIGTMALIPQVAETVAGRVPVLGAGSIMDGRSLVAALALGAEGVWCGSAFLATQEADLPESQKQAILDSDEDDTVVSRALTGKPARFIKSDWIEEFDAAGLKPLGMPLQGLLAHGVVEAALREDRADVFAGAAGQGIGLVQQIRPAADVLEEMVAEAHAILTRTLSNRITT